ncbi:MAG: alpha/beta hydrolase-fold protein [Bacteroidota bacterium]
MHLEREVAIDCFLPSLRSAPPLPLLIMNDGQDMEAVQLVEHLEKGTAQKHFPQMIVAAVYPGNRMQEYGTAHQVDYEGRGQLATAYSRFICEELLPHLQEKYPISRKAKDRAIAGFSLGGLSALDIAWQQSSLFGQVGIFSGSLWWRSKAFRPNAPDADRIAHELIQEGPKRENLRFWFQAGTKDEESDRNNNGIIDAIDDTLDLMKALEGLGYQKDRDITYVEVEGGEHHPKTWSAVLPNFLHWAFGS